MDKTYTFIARSTEQQERVATFTLHSNGLSIGLGPAIEQISRTVAQTTEEEKAESLEIRTRPWLKPLALSLLVQGTRPLPLKDVQASTSGDDLEVTAWIRFNGLRLLPITLHWNQVDNPAGAEDFVRELNERRRNAPRAATLPGLLDYWASWLVAGVYSLVSILRWYNRRQSES
jgi:hypothetical protein